MFHGIISSMGPPRKFKYQSSAAVSFYCDHAFAILMQTKRNWLTVGFVETARTTWPIYHHDFCGGHRLAKLLERRTPIQKLTEPVSVLA